MREPVSKEHVRHRRENGLENRCAAHRRPECNGLRGSASFQSRSAFSIAAGAAILWCSANFKSVAQSSGLRRETQPKRLNHFSSLCSSTAEHPPDKRETVARHHAEGPISKRWMAQTDEQRVEAPIRLARYQLQRPVLESSHELQLVRPAQSNSCPKHLLMTVRAEARHYFFIAALM